MAHRDDSPTMEDGVAFDGKELLSLVRSGRSPFQSFWDVNLLIREIEDVLETQVIDIPTVYTGANYYGFHIKLSNRSDIVARLSRGDVNMPDYDGFPFDRQGPEVKFEAAVYNLLRSEPGIMASGLLYHRAAVLHEGPRLEIPQDIVGRRLFLFERAEGEKNVWDDLNSQQRASLLEQTARIRAALFNFNPPPEFCTEWFLERLFEQKPKSIPVPVGSTREFCVALFTSKIEATIRNIGDMIGWESDNNVVGPIAAAAKQSLLRLIPHILPKGADEASLYRLVLEHDDFGTHNMSIAVDNEGLHVTSLYDWESGCIIPCIFSDPRIGIGFDLITNTDGSPSITPIYEDDPPEFIAEYMTHSKDYFEVLYAHAPYYKRVIQAGADARHLWFALKSWRGDDPEGYFGDLGAWADQRMKELSISGSESLIL